MKKTLFASIIAVVALLITSCSGDTNKLLKAIPADADLVAICNVDKVIESAGGRVDSSKIILPQSIVDILPQDALKEFEEFNRVLASSGIEVKSLAVVGKEGTGSPVLVFALENADKLSNCLKDNGFNVKSDEKGVQIYAKCTFQSNYSEYNRYSYIAVKGDIAYGLPDMYEDGKVSPQQALTSFIEAAADKAFNKVPVAEFISEGNAFGAAFRLDEASKMRLGSLGLPEQLVDMYEGYMCIRGDLNDDEAEAEMKWFDKKGKAIDGKKFKEYFDINGKVSSKALAYMQPDQQFVMAMCMKDVKWDKYFDFIADAQNMSRSDRAMFSVAEGYLSKINGTLAFGIGLSNGLESIFAISANEEKINENISATIVVETQKDKTQGLVNDIKGMFESMRVPFTDTSDGFTMEMPGVMTVYCKCDGNFIVISNREIAKASNPTVKEIDFTDNTMAAGIYLGKNDKLMQDLGLDYKIGLSTESQAWKMMSETKLEIKGGNAKGVIAKAIQIGIDIYNSRDALESKYKEYRSKYAPRYSEPIEIEEPEDLGNFETDF